ncbi:MAG: undecaprenyl/decaprenyl-phosphate alpha-N-acetylglucosaminyl 1-phosphate transferase [Cytophagaceae bacterium]|nr:undecaprenyl/decaprenyl-phosphate alpha-N-acetylglucosaminyl 1-phosphate transferase [Cytophagaceae bacterium]
MFVDLQAFLSKPIVQLAISFLVASLVAMEAIPVIINISKLKNLMDEPSLRSAHARKTPTLGGVAIFAATLIGYFLWENPGEGPLLHLTVVGLVFLFFLGVKDDILVLSPVKKMLVQIGCAGLLIIAADLRLDNFFGIFGWHEIPYFFSVPLTVFVFIALINAMNLIDGIDGLAGGIGLIAGTAFGLWFYLNKQYAMASMCASMSGALLGFLRFNFSHTSKIFMGDTGSLIVGFLLTIFAVKFIHLNVTYRFEANAYFSAPILAIVVLIVPIFDTLRVFIIRLAKKKDPFTADRNHMHHILIAQNMTHFQASAILCGTTVILTGLFLAVHHWLTNTESLLILVALFSIYLYTSHVLKQRVKDSDFFEQEKNEDAQKAFKQQAKARLKKIQKLKRALPN